MKVEPLPARCEVDFAAEQRRQLAADRKAKAGAAVFAAGAGVGLLERLEDQLLLFERECRCRCPTTSKAITAGACVQHRMFGAPAADSGRYAQAHATFGGELEGVGQQVLQDLLQALGVGDDAAREIGIDIDR